MPVAAYFYSLDRSGTHAETWLADYARIVQADAFSGFGRLYESGRRREAVYARSAGGPRKRSASRGGSLQYAQLEVTPIAVHGSIGEVRSSRLE